MPEPSSAARDRAARSFDRVLAAGLMVFLLVWSGVHLGVAVLRTGYLEQDSIYYAEVAERIVAGDGATSLADRRGYAPARPWPVPFEARTCWPWLLAGGVAVTGWPAWRVGQVANLGAFLLSIPLLTLLLLLVAPSLPRSLAVVLAGFAVSTQWGVRTAVVNEADGVGLALTIAVLAGCVLLQRSSAPRATGTGSLPSGRVGVGATWAAVVSLAFLAGAVRYQNVVLTVPVGWCVVAWLPGRLRLAGRGLAVGFVAVGSLAVFGAALPDAWDGLRLLLDPGERGSYLRTMRVLAPAGILGLALGLASQNSRPLVVPCALAGLAHTLVLLSFPDPNSVPRWLFGIRHGLPLHVVNAVGVAVFAAWTVKRLRTERARRPWTVAAAVLLAATLVGGIADNLPRANRLMRRQASRTELAPLDAVIRHLRAEPLPDGSVLAAWNCDLFAYWLGLPTVHLRGFSADRPDSIANLAARVSHVVFVEVETDYREVVELQARLGGVAHALREKGAAEIWSADDPGRWRVGLWRVSP